MTARNADAGGKAGVSAKRRPGRTADDSDRARQDLQAARFLVQTKKHSGRWIVFQRYRTREESDNAVRLLAWAGAIARVVEVKGSDALL